MDGDNDLGLCLEDWSAPYSRDHDVIVHADAQALSEELHADSILAKKSSE